MKCQYPACGNRAEATWALIPLCGGHREAIRRETRKYYTPGAGFTYADRAEYLKIAPMIRWSRARTGEAPPDDPPCEDGCSVNSGLSVERALSNMPEPISANQGVYDDGTDEA